MNRKLTFIIIIIITVFIIGIIIINYNDKRYEDFFISEAAYNKIINGKKKSNSIELIKLKFNTYNLIYDKNSNTWYYSLIENSSLAFNPYIKFEFNKKNIKLSIVEQHITNKLIENNQSIKLVIYNDSSYREYNIICTTLPIMSLTLDGPYDSGEDVDMRLYLFNNEQKSINRVIESDGKIHMRGASSTLFEKKSYKITLTSKSLGGNTRNNIISLLNMRKDDDWILYAAYDDLEKIRNVFATNLWYECCSKNNLWNINNGNEYKYIELFINNEYWGLYALGYPIDEKQLNISENPKEYLYKKSTWDNSELMEHLQYNPPDMPGYEYKNYNNDYDIAMENLRNYYLTLQTSNNLEELYELSDINNVIDFYLFSFFIANVDSVSNYLLKNYYLSLKYYNGVLVGLYTPWDLDLTFGKTWGDFACSVANQYRVDSKANINFYTSTIYKLQQLNDTKINVMIKTRYNELRMSYFSDDYINKLLNDYENKIFNSGAYEREKERWKNNCDTENNRLNLFKNYINERTTYMDYYIENL